MGLEDYKPDAETYCENEYPTETGTLGNDIAALFDGVMDFDDPNLPEDLKDTPAKINNWSSQGFISNLRDLIRWAWELIKAIWDYFFN